ncbi:MAG: acyltransferase [Clostridiales bacterium]|nr:acyltransferase [Clostridiales bacterium]
MRSFKMDWSIVSKYRNELLGIAILAVFCIHSNGFDWPSNLMIIEKVLSQGGIGVDVFLFLSGMGLYYSLKKDENIVKFYKHRFVRILPGYLFIAGIGYAIIIFAFGNRSIEEYLYRLSTISFWRTGEGTVWYISFIMIMYMIYPVIYQLRKKASGKYIFLLLIISVFSIEVGMIKWCPSVFRNIEAAISRVAVFLLGSYIAPWIKEARKINNVSIILWILAMVAIRMLRIIFISPESLYSAIFVRISNLFFTLIIVTVGAFVIARCPEFIRKLLRWFGERTLEIYLVHMFAINVFYVSPLSRIGNNVGIYFLIILPVAILIASGVYFFKILVMKKVMRKNEAIS